MSLPSASSGLPPDTTCTPDRACHARVISPHAGRVAKVLCPQQLPFNQVRQVLGSVLDHDLHAKRVDSLCDATLGVLRSASLAVCMIGQGLAAARGLNPKHATKQVDRLLSNPKINVDDILVRWVPYVVGARSSIVMALDWTDFDADNQATIMVSLITDHGRATPLVWLTVEKRTLKNNRSLYEQSCPGAAGRTAAG